MAGSKNFLSRDELFSGSHFRTHEILVGERKLRLRELTAEEWLNLSREEREAQKKLKEVKEDDADPVASLEPHFQRIALLVCNNAVNEKGERLFQDGDEEVIRQKLGAVTLMDIYRTLASLAEKSAASGGTPAGG